MNIRGRHKPKYHLPPFIMERPPVVYRPRRSQYPPSFWAWVAIACIFAVLLVAKVLHITGRV